MIFAEKSEEEEKIIEIFSSLYMVDLAGSERVKKSGADGPQLAEARAINQSLAALGNCINALSSSKLNTHIPYRSSKLTHLLSSNLGGNAKTLLVVCVSSRMYGSEEMLSALNFAQRAKRIRVNASIHQSLKEKEKQQELMKYEQMYNAAKETISDLEKELKTTRLLKSRSHSPVQQERKVIKNENEERMEELLIQYKSELIKYKQTVMQLNTQIDQLENDR